MVRRAQLILCAAWLASTAVCGSELKFQMEFSRSAIYAGETVECNFVVYAKNDDTVNVEVAKFPEFRGFWSENTVMRQGVMQLLPVIGDREGWRKTLVGTYLITPMIGNQNPSIVPMKLAIRPVTAPMHSESDLTEVILSKPSLLTIKPLPPPTLPGFGGAVGTFLLRAERNPVLFRPQEPTLIRLILEGEGNIREVNEVGIAFPREIQVLSSKSQLMGSTTHYLRVFEYVVSVNSATDLSIPPFSFSFFDPSLSRYEKSSVPEIRLKLDLSHPLANDNGEEDALLASPCLTWSEYRPIEKSIAFLTTQIILLSLLLYWAAQQAIAVWKNVRKDRPVFPHQSLWLGAKSAFHRGEIDTFLNLAENTAYHFLKEVIPPRSLHLSRAEAIRRARAHLSPELIDHAARLFTARDLLMYSRDKELPAHPETLLICLESLIESARQRRAASVTGWFGLRHRFRHRKGLDKPIKM